MSRHHRAISEDMRNRIRQGLERSATARMCPQCGRHGALVTEVQYVAFGKMVERDRSRIRCRWERDSGGRLCSYVGDWSEPLHPAC